MGYSTLIDILGSMLVGGMLMVILFRVNDATVENTFMYGGELTVQENLVEVVELLEYDFRKIAYCRDWTKMPNPPTLAILSASDTSITFLSDVATFADARGDGVVDTVRYYTGPVSELSHSTNPNDRLLYRVVNSETPGSANLGITRFNILYFDILGDTLDLATQAPSLIHTMQIDIRIEDIAGYDGEYSSVFWRQIRLAARNLSKR